MAPRDRILVLGLGNTLLSDDGVGVRVVEALHERDGRSPRAEYRDGGTIGLNLLPDVENCGGFVAVDAAELGARSGTVRVFEGPAMDDQLTGNKRTAHEVALADLMAAAALQGTIPERRALVAIQPGTTDWGTEPTSAVAAAIPEACDAVNTLIDRWAS